MRISTARNPVICADAQSRRVFLRLATSAVLPVSVPSVANAICVLGMGECPPTDAEAKAALEMYLGAIFNSATYKLTHFSKTNGQSLNVFGMVIYNYEFVASFELPVGVVPDKAFNDLRLNVCLEGRYDNNRCRFAYYILDQALGGVSLLGPSAKQVYLPKGPINLRGTLKFEKTEKGWRNNQQLSI